MSFILDALRRADRERESERGGVPSLYTQAAPAPMNPAPAADDAPRPWLWLAAGLGGGLVLAAVWALWSATPPSTVATASAPEQAAPPAVAATPAASAAPTPPAEPPRPVAEPAAPAVPSGETASRAPSSAESRGETTQAPARTRPAPPRATEPGPRAEAKPAPARPAPETERPAATRPDTARAPAARSGDEPAASNERAAAPPIRQVGELSAEVRSKLPALTIGGAMYSANASSRRLIVNGQLLSEGDAVAPGVTLEEIRLKSAVLRTKDLRYELGF